LPRLRNNDSADGIGGFVEGVQCRVDRDAFTPESRVLAPSIRYLATFSSLALNKGVLLFAAHEHYEVTLVPTSPASQLVDSRWPSLFPAEQTKPELDEIVRERP
jgi:hypothetical protein